jgi:hypothetical protein
VQPDQAPQYQQRQRQRLDRGEWNNRMQQPQAAQQLPQQNRVDRRRDRVRNDGQTYNPGVVTQQNAFPNDGRNQVDRNRNFGRDTNNTRFGNTDRRWNGSQDWSNNRGWNGNDNRRYDRGNNWNRNWRQDNRYNWQGYRNSNRQAYRLPRYYAPYGWNRGFQRFSIGAILNQGLFARNYWISDPYSYRLPDVQWPYQWVRYYNDALLIDTQSGQVVDVINDIFW